MPKLSERHTANPNAIERCPTALYEPGNAKRFKTPPVGGWDPGGFATLRLVGPA